MLSLHKPSFLKEASTNNRYKLAAISTVFPGFYQLLRKRHEICLWESAVKQGYTADIKRIEKTAAPEKGIEKPELRFLFSAG